MSQPLNRAADSIIVHSLLQNQIFYYISNDRDRAVFIFFYLHLCIELSATKLVYYNEIQTLVFAGEEPVFY
jgi:hypothetical protein